MQLMTETAAKPQRHAGSYTAFVFPLLFMLVFLMHFRAPGDFFHFRLHYVPRDPTAVVTALVRAQNHWPMLHDPHVIGYLGLPFLLVCAYTLFGVSRGVRPRLSAVAMFVTGSGTVYLGGLFGMWTAFYRGLGGVDPAHLDGAIATFKAMTAPQGAFLMTTTLAKFALIGLAGQGLLLWRLPRVRAAAPVLIALGSAMIVFFWDLDNWMLIGMMLIFIGFLLLTPALRRDVEAVEA